MNILVTGGAGFIGFHVAKRLLSDGHRVTILDNLSDFNSRELKLARLAELGIDTARIASGIPLQGPGALVFIQQDRTSSTVMGSNKSGRPGPSTALSISPPSPVSGPRASSPSFSPRTTFRAPSICWMHRDATVSGTSSSPRAPACTAATPMHPSARRTTSTAR